MAKYIIGVPDEAIEFMGGRSHINVFVEPECKVGDCKHYALRISKEDITPYTETDRKAVEDEVWEFVSKFVWSFEDEEILGMGIAHAVRDMTYQEAKARYEAWRKKEQIHVGDEVELSKGVKGCVYVVGEEMLEGAYLNCDGLVSFCWSKKECRKTGRHYDDIAELIKKVKREHD